MDEQHSIEIGAAIPINSVVEGYFAMWNEVDATRRREVIATTWAQEGRYTDPLAAAEGADALDRRVAGVSERFPGHRYRLTSTVDMHHDRARWDWDLIGADGGAPVVKGVDFAMLAPDGRLREVAGFFHQPGAPGRA